MSGMSRFKAIIFDCDGVLIDSEYLACDIEAKYLSSIGCEITTDEYLDRYMGKSLKNAMDEMGLDSSDCVRIESELLGGGHFMENLKAIKGVKKMMPELKLPYCIASGSSMDRLHKTLGVTGILEHFTGRIFSAEMVANPKPAPDVFLHAAGKLGITPKDCLVIEDGWLGTKGAIAAGMTVYGFTGATHMDERRSRKLIDVGAEKTFGDMDELIGLIG